MARTSKTQEIKPAPVPVDAEWTIGDIHPYGRNARLITEKAVSKVKQAIIDFGFTNRILVNAKGVILAGHTRYRAAQALGMKLVPVRVIDYLTISQERALRLSDNRSGEETSWDTELLALEVAELLPDLTDPSMMSFDAEELKDILAPAGESGKSSPGGEPGEKDFARSDGVYVEIFMTPAAYERHRGTLNRWASLKDVDINFPE